MLSYGGEDGSEAGIYVGKMKGWELHQYDGRAVDVQVLVVFIYFLLFILFHENSLPTCDEIHVMNAFVRLHIGTILNRAIKDTSNMKKFKWPNLAHNASILITSSQLDKIIFTIAEIWPYYRTNPYYCKTTTSSLDYSNV